jgi:hypothetical protein
MRSRASRPSIGHDAGPLPLSRERHSRDWHVAEWIGFRAKFKAHSLLRELIPCAGKKIPCSVCVGNSRNSPANLLNSWRLSRQIFEKSGHEFNSGKPPGNSSYRELGMLQKTRITLRQHLPVRDSRDGLAGRPALVRNSVARNPADSTSCP